MIIVLKPRRFMQISVRNIDMTEITRIPKMINCTHKMVEDASDAGKKQHKEQL